MSVGRAPLPFEAILPMVGDGARRLVERALAASSSESGVELVSQVLARFMDLYAAQPVVHTTLLPGARELLSLGLPTALVTNKPRDVSLLVLSRLGIANSFGAVFAGGDGPLKPSPDGVLAAASKLGVPPERAWLIGDGPQDVLAGHAAGCYTIAVFGIAERERVLAATPDCVVESLHDVVRLARVSLAST